jgi:hypothetical protein
VIDGTGKDDKVAPGRRMCMLGWTRPTSRIARTACLHPYHTLFTLID